MKILLLAIVLTTGCTHVSTEDPAWAWPKEKL